MGEIVLLDELTINKIAAGEVVERPASVVKEMVENSIDAGATNISIEIKNGGMSYIRISDNGKGIANDDMDIAFERHATSKIRSAEELATVRSMGFRGEALASIAAISKVELISKTENSDIANKIVVEAGKIIEKEQIGAGNGTTITVENLFFNTPVRYKFLKKDFTEAGYIEDCITRLSLINPNIAFKLISSGKIIIQTSGNGDLKSTIYSIFGKDIATNIVDVNYAFEDIKISGVAGKPEIARSNRTNQMFFVNNRYVKDNTLLAAIGEAYRGLLPLGKFGFAVLNVNVNPEKVDVNVHPAKLEVRFSEDGKVFKTVCNAVKNALLNGDLVSGNSINENKNVEVKPEIEFVSEPEKENAKANTAFDDITTKFRNLINRNSEKENEFLDASSANMVEEMYNQKMHPERIEKQPENESINIPVEESVSNKDVVNTDVPNAENHIDATMQISKIQEDLEKILRNNAEENSVSTQNDNIDNIQENNINETIAIPTQINNVQEDVKENDLSSQTNKTSDIPKNNEQVPENFDDMYTKLFGNKVSVPSTQKPPEIAYTDLKPETTTPENISIFEENEKYDTQPAYKFIGIVFSTYIIVEMKKDIYIIDQHAAHERIMYEKIKENFYKGLDKNSQMLLLPDVITLTHKEMFIAKENIAMFEKAGFVLEEFGENTIKLTGVPDICFDLDTKELFLDILDEIDTVARTARQEIEEKFIATVACKAAVKANMALTEMEVDALMDSLLKLENPFTCPHGRPTAVKMGKNDLEKKFSRR